MIGKVCQSTTVGERSKIKVRNVISHVLTVVSRVRDRGPELIGKVNSRESLDLSQLQLSIKNCIGNETAHVGNYNPLLEITNRLRSAITYVFYFVNSFNFPDRFLAKECIEMPTQFYLYVWP